jgi:hypothetical protein
MGSIISSHLLGQQVCAASAAHAIPCSRDISKLQVSCVHHHLQLTAGGRHLPEVGPVSGCEWSTVAHRDLASACMGWLFGHRIQCQTVVGASTTSQHQQLPLLLLSGQVLAAHCVDAGWVLFMRITICQGCLCCATTPPHPTAGFIQDNTYVPTGDAELHAPVPEHLDNRGVAEAAVSHPEPINGVNQIGGMHVGGGTWRCNLAGQCRQGRRRNGQSALRGGGMKVAASLLDGGTY